MKKKKIQPELQFIVLKGFNILSPHCIGVLNFSQRKAKSFVISVKSFTSKLTKIIYSVFLYSLS